MTNNIGQGTLRETSELQCFLRVSDHRVRSCVSARFAVTLSCVRPRFGMATRGRGMVGTHCLAELFLCATEWREPESADVLREKSAPSSISVFFVCDVCVCVC